MDPEQAYQFTQGQVFTLNAKVTIDTCGPVETTMEFNGEILDSTSSPISIHSSLSPQEIRIQTDDRAYLGYQDLVTYTRFINYPDHKSKGQTLKLRIIDPCAVATTGLANMADLTGEDYFYENEDDPSWVYQLDSDKLLINPSFCNPTITGIRLLAFSVGFFKFSVPDDPTAPYWGQKAEMRVGMTTRDMVTYKPAQYTYQILYKIGFLSRIVNIKFNLIDPCPTSQLSIQPIGPLVNQQYILRDPELVYEWTIDEIAIKTGTFVDCGAIDLQLFRDANNAPPNSDIFILSLASDNQGLNKLIVQQTDDTSLAGMYDFRYSLFYANYPQVGEEMDSPFTVTILDPCVSPYILLPPDSLSGELINYTIASPGLLYEFGSFQVNPSWCEVHYSYIINDPLGEPVIADFDASTTSFRFEYVKDLAPLEENILQESRDYLITVLASSSTLQTEASFTLRVQNPCSESLGFSKDQMPEWCPRDESTFWNPQEPIWMEVIQDTTIYTGQSFTYQFGEPINRYDQVLDVEMDLGATEDFAFYDHITNSYVIKGDVVKPGYWRLSITAEEVRNGRTYTYQKYFYINVLDTSTSLVEDEDMMVPIDPETGMPLLDGYLKKESLVRESQDETKPLPYVVDFDSKGIMSIGWTRRLIPPQNYTEIPEEKIVVTGNPRQMQAIDKVVPVTEDEEEYNLFIRKILELDALEIQFVDDYKEQIDVAFTWDIVQYTADDIKLQFIFESPDAMQSNYEETSNVRITFWATEFFKDETGTEVPFGTEINWEVFRQMKLDEVESVDETLSFAHVFMGIIAVLLLLIVLSCGPLLPFWMFLNSIQLMVHVPLIRTNIPANAHYFYLEYLNILRLHVWSFNSWLQEQAGASKIFDSNMAENESAEYYSSLVFTCGYSFSFLPNLILILSLFSVILLIWLLLLGRDLFQRSKRVSNSSQEPWMTNFCVRFLYEVFFELSLCIMINISFMDSDSGEPWIAAWVFCVILASIAILTLICITVLFWSSKGPSIKDAFAQKSFWSSIWGLRSLNTQTIESYLPQSKLKAEPASLNQLNSAKQNEEKQDAEEDLEDQKTFSQNTKGTTVQLTLVAQDIQKNFESKLESRHLSIPGHMHTEQMRNNMLFTPMENEKEQKTSHNSPQKAPIISQAENEQDDLEQQIMSELTKNYEGGELITQIEQLETARELLPKAEDSNAKLQSKKVDLLALKALMTVDAQIRLKLESMVRPSKRYRTLFYGLKHNHPHSAALVHPLVFLLRRILYSAIVLFMIKLPMIGAYLLAMVCVGMLAYIIVEKQWEDSIISWQHLINEIALYLVLIAVVASSLPLSSAMVSPVGWYMIILFLLTLIFNMVIIAYLAISHLRLLIKRHRHRLISCLKRKEKVVAEKKRAYLPEKLSPAAQVEQCTSEAEMQHVEQSNPTQSQQTKEPMLASQPINIPIKLETQKPENFNEADSDPIQEKQAIEVKSPIQELEAELEKQDAPVIEEVTPNNDNSKNSKGLSNQPNFTASPEPIKQADIDRQESKNEYLKCYKESSSLMQESVANKIIQSERDLSIQNVNQPDDDQDGESSHKTIKISHRPSELQQEHNALSKPAADTSLSISAAIMGFPQPETTSSRLTAVDICKSAKQEIFGDVEKQYSQVFRRSRYDDPTHSSLNKIAKQSTRSLESQRSGKRMYETQQNNIQEIPNVIALSKTSLRSSSHDSQEINTKGSFVEQTLEEKPQIASNLGALIEQAQIELEKGLVGSKMLRIKQQDSNLPPLKSSDKPLKSKKSIKKTLKHDMMNRKISLKQTIAALQQSENQPSSWVKGMKQRLAARDSMKDSSFENESSSSEDVARETSDDDFRLTDQRNGGMLMRTQDGRVLPKPMHKHQSMLTPNINRLSSIQHQSTPVGTQLYDGAKLLDELKSMNYLPADNLSQAVNFQANMSVPRRKNGLFESNIKQNQRPTDFRRRTGMFDVDKTMNDAMYASNGMKKHSSIIHDNRSQASSRAHEVDHLGKILHNSIADFKNNEASFDDSQEFANGNHAMKSLKKTAIKARRFVSKDQHKKSSKKENKMQTVSKTRKAHSIDKTQQQHSKLPQIKNIKSTASKEPPSQIAKCLEDPYDAHRYFVNNKQAKTAIKRIQGSYVQPGYEHLAKVVVPDATVQRQKARVLMNAHGGDCLDRKHYKCGCTLETKDQNPHGLNMSTELLNQINSETPANLMRYNNKVGFGVGLIFPVAKATNPPLMTSAKKRASLSMSMAGLDDDY